MSRFISRRHLISLMVAGAVLIACGSMKPFTDMGPKNVTVNLTGINSSYWHKREVSFEVWRGRLGHRTEYLGTTKLHQGKQQFGLALHQPLVIFLAFDEGGGFFDPDLTTDGIEILINAKPGQQFLLTASFSKEGFDYSFKRIR